MLPNHEKHLLNLTNGMKNFPWHDRLAYGTFLAQTYYYVCHSTRLLALSAGRMGKEDNKFHKRFLAHMGEESGHEFLALNDLKHLGFTIDDFPELPETRMFWETQYYKIEHRDPLSLLGYIFALESLASKVCPWIKQELEKHYPVQCHTFIKVHGEEDQDHVEKAREQISSLSPERQLWVWQNFEQTAVGYVLLLESIQRSSRGFQLLKTG